jgi:hypothetical protein
MVLDLLARAWSLVLLSLVLAAFAFPLVFVLGFIYDALSERYEKTPKIVWLFVCTFLGALAATLLLELYLGVTIASAVEAAGAP